MNIPLSNYARALQEDIDVFDCYMEKIEIIRADPYMLILNSEIQWKNLQNNVNEIPSMKEVDISDYFIHSTSFYTKQQFRAKKSLEGYNYFVSSHIIELKWLNRSNHHIVIAKVKHSLRKNDDCLISWLLLDLSGGITATHCTCMAGLDECCSHVAAICFCLEYYNIKKDSTTVTDVPAYWVPPGSSTSSSTNTVISPRKIEKVSYANVKNKRLRKNLNFDDAVSIKMQKTSIPKEVDKSDFLTKLMKCNKNAKVLKVVAPFCEQLANELETLPKSLTNLYVEENEEKDLDELIDIGRNLEINISQDDARAIEETTRKQSQCTKWFLFRTGRITASKSRQVCHVKAMDSNISLIKSLCYPMKNTFKVVATEWGCQHESDAVAAYVRLKEHEHENLTISSCGFCVSTIYPFLGASPDRIIQCDCCGKGVLEVKCPHCLIVKQIDDLKYLDASTGKCTLKEDHEYFFQMQTQLICLPEARYADFFIWSPTETHSERINPDIDMQQWIISASEEFFYHAILPELLGRYYTNQKIWNAIAGLDEKPQQQTFSFCYCKDASRKGKMIPCKMEGCPNVKYHYKCIGITKFIKNYICDLCAAPDSLTTSKE